MPADAWLFALYLGMDLPLNFHEHEIKLKTKNKDTAREIEMVI